MSQISSIEIVNLNTELIACILSFLDWKEVLKSRVCRQWREAAQLAPIKELYVNKRSVGDVLPHIANVLSNIEEVRLDFGTTKTEEFEIEQGESAEPRLVLVYVGLAPPPPPVRLEPLANFRHMKRLILRQTHLNGVYPFLFRFKHLEELDLLWNTGLKWDLADLSGLPQLRKLYCPQNHKLTGNLSTLRLLSQTLVQLNLYACEQVGGFLKDVSGFALLEELNVNGTKVTGDIREIGPKEFPSLKHLDIGELIYGGGNIPTIHVAPSIMEAKYELMKHIPGVFGSRRWSLADDSPDFYDGGGFHHSRAPPFYVEFVKAGNRTGWRWTNCVTGGSCETRWLDPEPDQTEESYSKYQKDLKEIKRDVGFYEGLYEPPSQSEHHQRNNDIPHNPTLTMLSMNRMFRDW